MESTVVFWIFIGFVFGGIMLALVMGYLSIEEERSREEQTRAAQLRPAATAIAAVPRFFPEVDAAVPALAQRIDPTLLAELENYVRAEQAVVYQFVNEPSIDALYRQTGASVRYH